MKLHEVCEGLCPHIVQRVTLQVPGSIQCGPNVVVSLVTTIRVGILVGRALGHLALLLGENPACWHVEAMTGTALCDVVVELLLCLAVLSTFTVSQGAVVAAIWQLMW